jgi:adenosylmethionine-8-amino-7-oxononanoate aminotransferase
MIGVELVKNKETKEPYPLAEKTGIRVSHECRKQGLLIRPLGNVVVLMPPLSVSLKDLKRMTDIVYDAVQRVTESA